MRTTSPTSTTKSPTGAPDFAPASSFALKGGCYYLRTFDEDDLKDVPPSLAIEREIWTAGYAHVAGVDEAGRGCLAGPVVAAAVTLPRGLEIPGLDDSKKLSAQAREELAHTVRESAIAVSVGVCSPAEVDELNVLWASMEAMRRAVFGLRPQPDFLLIDGNRAYPACRHPHRAVVQGDGACFSIAAASVIAKTERDRMMRALHDDFPDYHWITNVGYPTRAHYAALQAHGPTLHHRRSFNLGDAEASA